MPYHGHGRTRKTQHQSQESLAVAADPQSISAWSDYSSAPLPPRYAVTLAAVGRHSPGTPDATRARIEGAEFVSDAALVRGAGSAGLVPLKRRAGLWDGQARKGKRKATEKATGTGSQDAPLWRTAALLYTRTSTLAPSGSAYTPPLPAPHTSELAPLPPHEDTTQIPHIGSGAYAPLDWSASLADGDLDPALEELDEFDSAVAGGSWRQMGTRWGLPAHSTRRPESGGAKGKERATPLTQAPRLRVAYPIPSSSSASGSGSAMHSSSPSFFPPATALLFPPLSSSPAPGQCGPRQAMPLPSSYLVPATPDDPPSDPVSSGAMRAAWWRSETSNTSTSTSTATGVYGYGSFWAHLPRHTYPALYTDKKHRRAPKLGEFQLPRNIDQVAHPLHPRLSFYAAHARTRVYWIIPVHGPVLVPGLQDPITSPSARPWASRASFAPDPPPAIDQQQHPRPVPVHWTPSLLRAFVLGAFVPLWLDPTRPYGRLHLVCSGPKPDPYRSSNTPLHLDQHECLPPGVTGGTPSRTEAGDHIRLYCDASRAMSVRLWLHWWTVGVGNGDLDRFEKGWVPGEGLGPCEVPDKYEEGEGEGDDREGGGERDENKGEVAAAIAAAEKKARATELQPFKRARLALVGARGEVLMVA